MEKPLSITKRERDYILFNIRGFFRHYKLEQNINKISIDISNIQLLEKEVNSLLSQLNEYKEKFNNIIIINNLNSQNRQRLFVNRKNILSTKSTDIVMKRLNDKKQKTRMRELKYDLNKSNLTMRPKTPDVSKMLYKNRDKNKIKRNNENIKNLNSKIVENYNNLNSKSFIQRKKYIDKYNTKVNTSSLSNNYLNTSNISKKTAIKNNNLTLKNKMKDNSVEYKNIIKTEKLNYTINKSPNKYEKMKQKILTNNHKGPNKLNIIALRDLSPANTLRNKIVTNKTKNIKKLNMYDRYHSSDITRKKSTESKRIQNMQSIISPLLIKNKEKKIMKLNIKKRSNMKTPSPKTFRKNIPLLIDHDTIMRNKNKKINYNGRYHSPSFVNNRINNNTKEKNRHNKIKSELLMNKNDISKDEEKKLDEIINSKNALNQNFAELDGDINNKNILDLSQKILNNLENMNNNETNKYINGNEKKRRNMFMSNYIESLYLTMKFGFFTPSEKIKLLLMSKELYFKFEIKDIINDYIKYYENEINLISSRINNYDINTINRPFIPRKTGINSLNFITKSEEQRLINESNHDYVIKIFKIILIFLNENNNIDNNKNIFEFIFNDIYKKNNVNNIKDLFIKNFVDKIPIINDTQFEMLNDILKEVPDLLSPSTLLAYNRNVSYLIFFLSELYNYFSFKTNDGVYYYKIRNDCFKLNEYINKINKLKTYL